MLPGRFRSLFSLGCILCLTTSSRADYHDYESLTRELNRIADTYAAASVETFGQSRGGRELYVLTLAADGDIEPQARTAVLVVGGLDGDRNASGETALRIAEKILKRYDSEDEAARALLGRHTVYVVCVVNADAWDRRFAMPLSESRLTGRPVDDDRDGVADEDGPDDLNGDGLITMMRVVDPEATYMLDAKEPRLLRSADRAKDETPVYKVYVEGIDNDGDGEYNEDPIGGVDLNANFPHGYREHAEGAGPYQLCEPESRALINFVIDHPHIAAAITLGKHNNVLNVDKGGKKDATGEAPVTVMEEDAAIFSFIGERFKELTGIEKADEVDGAGAFHSWAYAQYGIPSFAVTAWRRPEPQKDEADEADGEAESAAEDDEPESKVKDKDGHGHGHGHGKKRRGRAGKKKADKESGDIKEALAWLTYSDDVRGGEGFVPWRSFKHPTLGDVEIGGFVPYFKADPPADQLDKIAEGQVKFLLDVGGRLPQVSVENVEVAKLHDGVFEIKANLTNSGYFPTGLKIAQVNRRVRPIVVTLDVGAGVLLGGERLQRVWNVDGRGGVHRVRWLVRNSAEDSVTLQVYSEKYGDFTRSIALKSTEGGVR